MKAIQGNGIIEGKARGEAIVSSTPFGFFGGVNPGTGVVIDKWHELYGKNIKDKIFIYPEGRGSTVGAAIILELARTGCAPAAIINCNIETITAGGGVMAKTFYDVEIPMVDGINCEELLAIENGQLVEVDGTTGVVNIL
jgi:predicted aconitase with swiveling domain